MSPKPWTAPSRPITYDRDQKALFEAVGGALSSWQYVEDVIASIFNAIVSESYVNLLYAQSMSPAERAYGSVVSFDGRASMVEAAAEAFFHIHKQPVYQRRLSDLLKSCRGWSGRRNEVAHGRIGGAPTDLNCCVLWPSEFSSRKNDLFHKAAFVYNSEQINEFDRQFLNLHSELLDFYGEFRAWREGRLEEYLAPPHELPTHYTEARSVLE